MGRWQVTETDLVRAWNWYHPEDVRRVPPQVLQERIPVLVDDLDSLLAVYILQAQLEDKAL